MEQPTSSMKIKSYFASSVEQAIQEARQELGTDAMLITSRRSSPETRSLGAYEVVFGLQGTSNPAGARPRASVPSDLSGELQQLRAQLQEIKSTLKGARGPEAPSSEAEELPGLCDRVLVLAEGRIIKELNGGEITRDAIVYASYHSTEMKEGQ